MSTPRSIQQTADRTETRLADPPRTHDGLIDVDRLYAEFPGAILLEDATGNAPSFLVVNATVRVSAATNGARLDTPAETFALPFDPFAALDAACDMLGVTLGGEPVARDTPLLGGLVGAFAYELGQHVEQVPSHPGTHRLFNLTVADTVLRIDAAREKCDVLITPTAFTSTTASARLRELDDKRVQGRTPKQIDSPLSRMLESNLTADAYYQLVRRIKEHIASGYVFQVNLSQQFRVALDTDLAALYRALRTHSAAPFGAVFPDVGVAAVSPETFLDLDGFTVQTRPIKGTRRRHDSPAVDAALADDLATSVKDRAENVMVVDMERNDLGRVCVPGSVTVPSLTKVVAHPTVWHLESTVAGTLRPEVSYGTLLHATFPCGSITGAPKRQAMRYIAAYEPDPRGFYCGAYGYLASGSARLAVGIRTAQYDGHTAMFGAGGGIVADSTPTGEYLETLEKAELFRRAVNGEFPLPTV